MVDQQQKPDQDKEEDERDKKSYRTTIFMFRTLYGYKYKFFQKLGRIQVFACGPEIKRH